MKTTFKMLAILSVVLFSSCAVEFGCPGSITSAKQNKSHLNRQDESATALNSEDHDFITKGQE